MPETLEKRPITKMAFALVVISFLLSTTVSLVSLHIMSQHNEREINRVLTTQIYDYMSGELSGPITAARTMASNSFLIDTLQEEEQLGDDAFAKEITEYLKGLEDGLGYQSSFVVSDATKRYYTRNGLYRTVDPAHSESDSWYAEFADGGLPYDLDVDASEDNPNDLAVYVNVKVADDKGDLLGVCGFGVHMTGMQELFRTFEKGFSVKIDLVDSDGLVQVDTNNDNIEKTNLGDLIDGKKSGEYEYEELAGGGFAVTKYVDALDWYLIVQSNGAVEAGRFANVIALNAALCVLVLVALFVALRFNRRRTNALTNASLVDQPTGLLNKRAFGRDTAQLSKAPLDSDFVYATIDVNGLKTVNDNLGHDVGDELIRGAADCLRACLGKFGKIYRVGGDEFVGLLHVPEKRFEGMKQDVERTVSEWSGENVGSLSLSCGYAPAREFPGESVSTLGKVSDERMYEAKKQHYEQTGNDRRSR